MWYRGKLNEWQRAYIRNKPRAALDAILMGKFVHDTWVAEVVLQDDSTVTIHEDGSLTVPREAINPYPNEEETMTPRDLEALSKTLANLVAVAPR